MTGMSFGRSFYGLVSFWALFHIKAAAFVYQDKGGCFVLFEQK